MQKSAIHEIGNILILLEFSKDKLKEKYPELKEDRDFMYLEDDIMSAFSIINSAKMGDNVDKVIKYGERQCKTCDIKVEIERIVNVFGEMFKKKKINITAFFNISERSLPIGRGDLSLVIENIVKNACEELSSCRIADKRIHINAGMLGDEFIISIKNNGRIIEKKKQTLIFSENYSEKKGGMGIGLFTCRSLMESIGGKIKVISDEISDTTFEIHIPTV